MSLRGFNIEKVLESLVDDLRRDFIESHRDEYIAFRRRVYSEYYGVRGISINNDPVPIAFIDAGFKIYQFDVSMIIPMQIGAYIRANGDKLLTVTKTLGYPSTDTILLYSSRRRSGENYVFSIKIRSFQDKTLLFKSRDEAEEASKRINKLLSETRIHVSKGPKLFVKLTKYMEGLLELAYTIKLLMLSDEAGLEYKPVYAVLDGTLIKWFSIKRQKYFRSIDGLDVLSAILGVEPERIKEYLFRIVGLSKTTKFTNIIRAQTLFLSNKKIMFENPYGSHAIINTEKLEDVSSELNKMHQVKAAKKFIEETIKLFNRIVYNLHNIYVARFPITCDYRTIFMLDIHLDKPIIWFDKSRNKFLTDRVKAEEVNPYISYIINTLYSRRSGLYNRPLTGSPPYGYMETDLLVRFNETARKLFEDSLIRILSRYDDLTARILEQLFSPTTRMRYGYR